MVANPRPYVWLAKYYDHLFEYPEAFDRARRRVIGPLLPKIHSACDLCCGTGRTAIRLASRGIRTYAVDLSPEMCRVARAKARLAGLSVRVIRADMREFRLPQPVDLVTCECDGMNHLPRKQDLRRVLTAVAKALRPGGYFSFDVNNRAAFERIWAQTWFFDKGPVAMVMQGAHRPGTDRASAQVDWFIREGKTWRRHHEEFEEVCWLPDEISDGLRSAGFDPVRSWDAAPFFRDNVTLPGNRTFWLARKI